MNQKYLIPIAVGVAVILVVLIASMLFMVGNEEGSAGVVAAAAGAAELARRRRASASEDLDTILDESDADVEGINKVLDKAEAEMATNKAEVDSSSLSDLVAEENERLS